MKWLILAACLAAILVVDSQRRRRCSNEDQCPDENECCLRKNGNRDTGYCEYKRTITESCRKDKASDGTYITFCPCVKGLVCDSMNNLRPGDRGYLRSLRCRTPPPPQGAAPTADVGGGDEGEIGDGETGEGTELAPGAEETTVGEGTDGGQGA